MSSSFQKPQLRGKFLPLNLAKISDYSWVFVFTSLLTGLLMHLTASPFLFQLSFHLWFIADWHGWGSTIRVVCVYHCCVCTRVCSGAVGWKTWVWSHCSAEAAAVGSAGAWKHTDWLYCQEHFFWMTFSSCINKHQTSVFWSCWLLLCRVLLCVLGCSAHQ